MRFIASKSLLCLMAAALAGGSLLHAQAPFAARAGSPAPVTPAAHRESHTRLLDIYGQVPLHFERNEGQVGSQVNFLARGSGYSLFLTPTEAVLALKDRGRSSPAVLRLKLAGANPRPDISGRDALPGKINYFLGNDPAGWRTNIPTYARAYYRSVYPGIDLVYYGNQRQLEYDFVVAPGADPGRIRMAFDGARDIRIDASGDLVLEVAGGHLRQHKPVVYQELQGVRQEIAGRYVMKGKRQVGFELGVYDEARPLVIDPVLIYSTYLGGTLSDQGHDIAVDAAGNAYVTGETNSGTFPTASPPPATPFDPTLSGNIDAFVTKLNATGSALVYSTYLGGTGNDPGNGIAVDADGFAYVVGTTTSGNFPLVNALDSTLSAQEAFVTKLNREGSSLEYSTFLGGTGNDLGNDIAVDGEGNAYVTGQTLAANFTTAGNAFQTANAGGSGDAFFTKLNSTGSTRLYSTYFGGGGADVGNGITVDAGGNAYVVGTTASDNLPVLNAVDPIRDGQDAFVAKFDPAAASGAASRVYSTFLGGTADEVGNDIAVDSSGDAYVTGRTTSVNFPMAGTPYQPSFGLVADAFVTKLAAAGAPLVYSTFLGGNADDSGTGIAVDALFNAYVTGRTTSGNFDTHNAFDTTLDGTSDAFVTKVDAGASALVYSTYLGGGDDETGNGIAVDVAGNAYVTGFTQPDLIAPLIPFPTTMGAYDESFNGGIQDAFVVKIGEDLILTLDPPDAFNPVGSQHCVTATLEASGNPVPGVIVRFTVTGAVNQGGPQTTDANGQAEFCYTGPSTPGADAVSAFADMDADLTQDIGEPNAGAAKTWVTGPPATLVLTPAADTNLVGTQHCVSAEVDDTFGNPTSGITVRFSVTGAVTAGGMRTTDLNGVTSPQFCYMGPLTAGADAISAFADTNGDGVQDPAAPPEPAEPGATATKTWEDRSATTTTVISSPNPSVFGQAVLFTATVTSVPPGSGVPGGTVTFFDGVSELGIRPVNGARQAFLTISTLVARDHQIVGVYNGDAFFNTSTSPGLLQTVAPAATTTTLSSSVTPSSMSGQVVTFTAAVAPVAPGGGIVLGTVTFTFTFEDGVTTLATVRLNDSGQALFATSSLAVGSHTISADYSGDGNFHPSSSAAPITQTVNKGRTSTSITSTPNPSVLGQNVTLTAHVTPLAPAARTLAFGPPLTVEAGTGGLGTFAVASGDFNGDGRRDLAVANKTANNLSVLLGDGTGGFGSPTLVPVGTGPVYVVAADLDGDSRLDLVTANEGSNNVSVLGGNGDGTFDAAVDFDAGNGPNGLDIGNFTSDLHLDIAIANAVGNTVTILSGDGALGFISLGNFSPGSRPLQVFAGDFNSDGDLDYATVNVSSSAVTIRFGDGTGGFQAPMSPLMGRGSLALVVADFDIDGKLDLATANRDSGDVTVRLGAGNFGDVVPYRLGASPDDDPILPEFMVGGDFNGDGYLDLAVTDSNHSRVSILTGTGLGTFDGPVTFDDGVPAFAFAPTAAGRRIVAADLNGDGMLDLALPTLGNDVKILLNTGVGPTGTVQFKDDGVDIGNPAPIVNGTASLSTSALTVGVHPLTADYSSDANYDASSGSTDHEVIKANTTTTVTSSGSPSVYGQLVTFRAKVTPSAAAGTPTGMVRFMDDAMPLGDPVTLVGGVAELGVTTLRVRSHIITADYLGDGSFNPSSGSVDQTVSAAALTVTATDRTKTYGDTVVFAGVEFTTNGLFNTDTVSSVTLTSAGAGPGATVAGGPYSILASAAVGSGLDNYIVSYVDGLLAVDPAVVTVTATDRTKTYGDTVVFAGVEFTTDGLFNTDTVSSVTLTSAGAAAEATVAGAPYQIVSSAAVGTGLDNYTISYADGLLTVNPAPLTVRADDASRAHGAANPPFTASYSGFVLGQDPSVLGGTLTFTTPATTTSDAGTYAITPTGLTSGNYAITFVGGTLTVASPAGPVLSVTKRVDKPTVSPGAALVYTLTYSNTGSEATGVTISDVVPERTTFVSASHGGTNAAGTVLWTIGNVAAGASGSVTLTVRVSQAPPCRIDDEDDRGQSGHRKGDGDRDDEDHRSGRNGHHRGDGCAHDDDDDDDRGQSESGHREGDGDRDDEDHRSGRNGHHRGDGCPHDDDDDDKGCTVTVTNKGAIRSIENPASTPSNIVTTTVTSRRVPVMSLVKAVNDTTAVPGDTLTYKLTYSNTGSDATGVTMSDEVPEHTTFVSASHGGTNAAGTVRWTIGNVAAGAAGSVTLTVRVNQVPECRTDDEDDGGKSGHRKGDGDRDDDAHRSGQNGHYRGDGCPHDDDDDNDNDNEGCTVTVTNKGAIRSIEKPSPGWSNTVTTQVTARSERTKGRMTGGGTFGTQRVHHGFTLNCDAQRGSNNLQVTWGSGNRFHLEGLTSAACADDPRIGPRRPSASSDTYRGTGVGRYNGARATAEWTFTDAGEPGNRDTAIIVIRNAAGRIVLSASGSISNGNHQAH